MTHSGHSALLTNVVADDAAGEAGFRLPRLPRRRIDTAGAPVPLPGRFFFFSATAGKKIPCDDHHCARGCVGLTFHPKSTRIWDGNHVAADSANHDRRRDGVDRERVGVRGGRIGRRVNPPVHLTGGRPLGAVSARPPPTASNRVQCRIGKGVKAALDQHTPAMGHTTITPNAPFLNWEEAWSTRMFKSGPRPPDRSVGTSWLPSMINTAAPADGMV